jgi:hypothetical protein
MPNASVTSPHPVTTSADGGGSGFRYSAGYGEIVVPWQIPDLGAPGAGAPPAVRSSAEIVVEWQMTGPVFAHAASAQNHPGG